MKKLDIKLGKERQCHYNKTNWCILFQLAQGTVMFTETKANEMDEQ